MMNRNGDDDRGFRPACPSLRPPSSQRLITAHVCCRQTKVCPVSHYNCHHCCLEFSEPSLARLLLKRSYLRACCHSTDSGVLGKDLNHGFRKSGADASVLVNGLIGPMASISECQTICCRLHTIHSFEGMLTKKGGFAIAEASTMRIFIPRRTK